MPVYAYLCESCGNRHEEFHYMSEAHPPCPHCGAPYGEVFHQDWSQVTPYCRGEITTFGQQAEKNAKALGREGIERLNEPVQRKNPLPWYRNGKWGNLKEMEKPLDLSKVKDTQKYIETGKKD